MSALPHQFGGAHEEDCGACDNLKQLSAMTGGSIFSDLKKTRTQPNQTRQQPVRKENKDTKPSIEESPSQVDPHDQSTERPLNFEELGQSTWSLLHTMAAYYPDKPSETRQQATSSFINSLAEVYPCRECAADFKEELKEVPPRLDSRDEFSQWACEIHNVVNKKLGKNIFPCSKVDQRWRFDPSNQDKLYE